MDGWPQSSLIGSLSFATIMAKSPEVKLAVFGRAGVGKSGRLINMCVSVCVFVLYVQVFLYVSFSHFIHLLFQKV